MITTLEFAPFDLLLLAGSWWLALLITVAVKEHCGTDCERCRPKDKIFLKRG